MLGSHTCAVVEGRACKEAGPHRRNPGRIGSACLHHQETRPREMRAGFGVVCIVCVCL